MMEDQRWSRLSTTIYINIVVLMVFTYLVPQVQLQQLRYNKELSKDVTSLLDSLLHEDKYDKRFRPNFGGPPVEIQVNMYIKSLGPISETDEVYSMDCYFRQMWFDNRLKFNTSVLKEFSMNWLFLEKVWKPDTYFVNGKKSYLHSITVPNKFLRLREDGFLTYSMRLTIQASCPMHLRKFPLDSQMCPLEIGSYGYNMKDVIFAWNGKSPVGKEEGVNLAQYDLVDIKTQQETRMSSRRVISVYFYLKRHTGYFMLQVYVPCTLIVICSFVNFWIDPAAVPARVCLGVTTVLSMTTLGFGGRSQMPKTSYATALDWFVILCFAFVFASMVEYAAINFIDKMTKDMGPKVKEKVRVEEEKPDNDTEISTFTRILRSIPIYPLYVRIRKWGTKQFKDPWNVPKNAGRFSKIDIYARKIFPLSFASIHAIYWTSFYYYIEDEFPSENFVTQDP